MRNTLFYLAVLALAAPGFAQTSPCTPFYDRAEFEAFNQGEGKRFDGIETFEESNIVPSGKQFLTAPLDQNPNTFFGVGFPNGLTQQNLVIWDNVTPGPNPPDLNPSGSMFALYVIGTGFLQAQSNKVGSDLFVEGREASLDLVFPDARYSGVGFELSWFYTRAGWHVSIYNEQGETIAQYQFAGTPGPEPQTSFFGVWCEQRVGRINIFDDAGPSPDAIVNIQMWM